MIATIFGIDYKKDFEVKSVSEGLTKLKALKKELGISLDMIFSSIPEGFTFNSQNGKIERIVNTLKPNADQKLVDGKIVAKTDADYIAEGKKKLEWNQKLNSFGFIEYKTRDEMIADGSYPIELAIKDKKTELNNVKNSYISKGIVSNAKIFQCDDNSVVALKETLDKFDLGLLTGNIDWKLKDNTFVTLSVDALKDVYKKTLQYRDSLTRVTFKLKSEIENLQTLTKINSYNTDGRFASEISKYQQ